MQNDITTLRMAKDQRIDELVKQVRELKMANDQLEDTYVRKRGMQYPDKIRVMKEQYAVSQEVQEEAAKKLREAINQLRITKDDKIDELQKQIKMIAKEKSDLDQKYVKKKGRSDKEKLQVLREQ